MYFDFIYIMIGTAALCYIWSKYSFQKQIEMLIAKPAKTWINILPFTIAMKQMDVKGSNFVLLISEYSLIIN